MPFLSPSGSTNSSPKNKTLSRFNGPATSSSDQQRRPLAGSPNITYIPPLIDGACGTTLYSQRSITQRMRNNASQAIRLLPSLVYGAIVARMEIAEMIQHIGLALLEIYMLVSAVPLWLALPGALFTAWVGCCSALIMGMSWSLNGQGPTGEVIRSPSPAATDGWMMGQEADDEQWFFIGGLGTSSKSLTTKTLPTLARLFSRTIRAVHEPTYGLPFDFLSALLQRCLDMPFLSTTTPALYIQIRTALLDKRSSRTVILAHNVGAITVSQLLRQLYADVPTDKMSRLEIYTFGAAAVEFVIPLGGPIPEIKTIAKQNHALEFVAEPRGPHIEHFAFWSDPFARMGVIRSVHEDLAGRFCGSVYMLSCPGMTHRGSCEPQQMDSPKETWTGRIIGLPTKVKASSRPLMSLNDYLSCLFPDKTQTKDSAASTPSGQSTCSILDDLMIIDKDLAEKREFTALAKDSVSHMTKSGKKRLSWTRLGATAGGITSETDREVGLEMARKGCKDCVGHRGWDVSRLANYVCIPSQSNDTNKERNL